MVCLECGKQFEYLVSEMRIGKPIAHSPVPGAALPVEDKPRRRTLRIALKALVAGAVMLGALFTGRRKKGN